jgi:hypothetical protein
MQKSNVNFHTHTWFDVWFTRNFLTILISEPLCTLHLHRLVCYVWVKSLRHTPQKTFVIGVHWFHHTQLGCSVMHTFIPIFYTHTTWFFIVHQIFNWYKWNSRSRFQSLGALASILHYNDENPHFYQFKHAEISFTSVVSSDGCVLWFCYKLQFWGFIQNLFQNEITANSQFLKFCEEPAKDLWWR